MVKKQATEGKGTVFGVPAPKKTCIDKKCPFHGTLNVKKESHKGVVFRKDIHHTATIEWFRPYYLKKYERFEKRRSRVRVHNPPCLDAQVGQEVLAIRCRPLSKTKNFVIVKIIEGKK